MPPFLFSAGTGFLAAFLSPFFLLRGDGASILNVSVTLVLASAESSLLCFNARELKSGSTGRAVCGGPGLIRLSQPWLR
jgi:hypothetical protein